MTSSRRALPGTSYGTCLPQIAGRVERRSARRLLAAALLALAGCDDATVITHVDRLQSVTESDLFAMQQGGGIPTEIHGTPFTGAAPDALAGWLQGPAGASAVRFRAVPVGATAHGARAVLHFNPQSPPNPAADCRRSEPARTGAPQPEGFSVTFSFCEGSDAIAHGHLKALRLPEGDFEKYQTVMRSLLLAIFREEKDR